MKKFGTLRCSFCRKRETQVLKLVAGPGVLICDECVAVAARLMQTPPDPPLRTQPHASRRGIIDRLRRALGCGARFVSYAP